MSNTNSSRGAARRNRAIESFTSAAECIGPVTPGMSIFAITRGQFSMIDAILHVLDQVGVSRISLWTWTIADYEIQIFNSLQQDGRIDDGLLIIDGGARDKNMNLIMDWKRRYGRDSVRYVRNHAKIATVEGGGLRVLLRGSMNLNCNPRFEQVDITEGGEDFDLVRKIESELPVLEDGASCSEVIAASKVSAAFDAAQLEIFQGVKIWKK